MHRTNTGKMPVLLYSRHLNTETVFPYPFTLLVTLLRYCLGDSPIVLAKKREKDDKVVKPNSNAISVKLMLEFCIN